ncbi:MAG: putative metal-binding motif-containing protein [Myxococcota bacterium]
MPLLSRSALALGVTLLAAACSEDSPADAGRDAGMLGADGGAGCGRVCDDGLFCNGIERCLPEDAAADADGCVVDDPPCGPTQVCDEAADRCDGTCVDADEDGFDDAACGGFDCDDANPDINPGQPELCDRMGVDEDCNPDTLGPDEDGDGFVFLDCCQRDDRGALTCGTDCDDTLSGVNPGAADACGAGDEDCDGRIDEEPDTIWYRDFDSDGFGRDDDTLAACSLPPGYALLPGDCEDDLAANPRANAINPAADELCNAVDDDCDATIDEQPPGEECECTDGEEFGCGASEDLDGVGICRRGRQVCLGGLLGGCVGGVVPRTGGSRDGELCDIAELDEDCDGMANEGCECVTGLDQFCGESGALGVCAGGLRSCTDGTLGPCSVTPGSELCDAARLDEDCDGERNEDCACVNGDRQTCAVALGRLGACALGFTDCIAGSWSVCSVVAASEVCDAARVDEDCDGTPNEGCACDDGDVEPCGSNVGACAPGTQVCSGGTFGPCTGDVRPATEVCDGSVDEDCDGTVDNGCACTNGTTRPCGLTAVGACELGTETCAEGAWGSCIGEVAPRSSEVCGAGDADCDGRVDETPESAPAIGSVRCYPDVDGDGFGQEGATGVLRCECRDDETDRAPSDCNDTDEDVFPGQTASFTDPHCPPGFDVCPDATLPRGVGCVVAGTPCAVGAASTLGLSWDYDCDGVETITVFLSPISSCSAPLACTGSGETVHWQRIVACGPVPTTGGIARTSVALACEVTGGTCMQTSATTPGIPVGAPRPVPCR